MEKKIIGYIKADTQKDMEELVMKLLEKRGIFENNDEEVR